MGINQYVFNIHQVYTNIGGRAAFGRLPSYVDVYVMFDYSLVFSTLTSLMI